MSSDSAQPVLVDLFVAAWSICDWIADPQTQATSRESGGNKSLGKRKQISDTNSSAKRNRHEGISQKRQPGIEVRNSARRETREALVVRVCLFFTTSVIGVFCARGSEEAQSDVGQSLWAICAG
jgi:hypothetical protein